MGSTRIQNLVGEEPLLIQCCKQHVDDLVVFRFITFYDNFELNVTNLPTYLRQGFVLLTQLNWRGAAVVEVLSREIRNAAVEKISKFMSFFGLGLAELCGCGWRKQFRKCWLFPFVINQFLRLAECVLPGNLINCCEKINSLSSSSWSSSVRATGDDGQFMLCVLCE